MPVADPECVISLNETVTPILPVPRLGRHFGLEHLFVKDESRLPTGSFKARGMAMAVTKAREFGIKKMAVPTAGNAGGALAAYAARAGIKSWVFMPEDTPAINKMECVQAGARTFVVNGLIDDCGKIVAQGEKEKDWFNVSTLKEPYRIEGKKTMGLELAEQFEWNLPDVILYPTGGGTGLIGMWKAFAELIELGWLEKSGLPRMVAVQASGCAPIVRAYDAGMRFAKPWEDAHTFAAGIRVPAAIGDFLILDAVRESGGFAIAVDDDVIEAARLRVARDEGLLLCPEGAATYAAYLAALADGRVRADERAVLFNCATGLKYPMPAAGEALDLANPA